MVLTTYETCILTLSISILNLCNGAIEVIVFFGILDVPLSHAAEQEVVPPECVEISRKFGTTVR